MPQLAEGRPSRAALNGLPSATRNDPLRSLVASPSGQRLELRRRQPRDSLGHDHGQVAARVGGDDLGVERLAVDGADVERCAPLTTWKAVRISPASPMTTPEP